ncbi:RsmB/NOP family class I SAM-dependent RNA methyltransferase [Sphingomonas sp. HDW15A]|uniref:RsmB/NOP family class I SAM-dependent RNA methyltransferase n=1 Tax=Sphingomonas sp. HDW15A TaxID=2714942 RepID=UPI00140E6499|nr:RsmB/NOP family class I SAM-dependent RNA methyltransferase [Sphingomonas sp. HDW15A]QIK96940.1 RsmB/NOP family class I SAM-dependent RNA methyltransferase [Sphingomonas sp. HDW15A]
MPSSSGPIPPGTPARRAALTMLDSVLRRGQTLESASGSHRVPLEAEDRRLALAIAGETLRRLPALDAMIDSRTRQILPDDSKARMVLRLALAQKLALDVPDHAIVATALPLVDGGPRRLVHGVLGALLRGVLQTSSPLPQPVEGRWRNAWGQEVVEAARRSILQRPPLDLSFRDEAGAQEFPLGMSLASKHRRIESAAVPGLPGYDEGGWWVQDLASSLPARLIPQSANTVLDLCAAPGGKTMQLAAAGHDVTALDRSKSRLARLRDNLARTGLAATTVVADALEWSNGGLFDAVLLDAPCSASGTFRRHPEVLYRARQAIIAESAELQAQLLDRAAACVRVGGSLVYAVCSLEPEEGESQLRSFLDRHPHFRLEPAGVDILGIAPSPEGWLRILPGMLEEQGGLDGFFTAHLVRDG